MIVLNGAPWIGQQLEALTRQRNAPDWELVVADNGSTDGTQEIVRARMADFAVPVRLVDASDAPGASHARNVGASAARGNFLAFCDCDDRADEHWVSEAAKALRTHHCVGGLNRVLHDPHNADSDVINPGGLHGRGIVSCNFAVRRDTFFAVGGFDESLPPYGIEDSEFSLRVLDRGLSIVAAPDMLLYFRRTVGFRKTMGKVYASGVAETVVWHRYPQNYGRPITLLAALGDLVKWPWAALRQVLAGEATGRGLARSAVTTWAHVVGYWTWVRRGRAGIPRLTFEPYDVT